ncbi:MAG: ATP-binding protein [Bacteroidales bacterium]|nr:ATP-binding protein [Bacteroidales bacterium]
MIEKEKIKEVIFDQKEVFEKEKHLIPRDIPIKQAISTNQIVIISGVRRCGKSSLLYLIKEEMKLNEEDYCYFNFDDERIIPDIQLLGKIYNLHLEIYGKTPVLFFDEIQNINGWEKFINRMYEQQIKIFVTGSNANLLSSEIATSLTGRNIILELYPFSFKEYLRLKEQEFNIERLSSGKKALLLKSFNHYFQTGGFPLVIIEDNLELINAYFQDILYRDIISRHRISQVEEIKQIGLYFATNTGKLFSYKTLQKISGIKSTSSVKNYLHYYSQSYLFFFLKKFDYSVKKQIMNPRKVYTIDQGFSARLGFNFSENKGRILENIVCIELLRRGKEIYYYTGKNECDFLIKEGTDIKQAIQVCYEINIDNEKRETAGLIEAQENFSPDEALLLTYDETAQEQLPNKNIKTMPVWKWLLQE